MKILSFSFVLAIAVLACTAVGGEAKKYEIGVTGMT
jgi:hypothetical protein